MDQNRPNILFIMTDEQRFDHLGSVNPAVKTPHLDALANDGVLFSRAYTPNPSCVPARAGIFTGKYPHQCAAPTFITYLPAHEKTFMSYLQEAGYYTAVIGKQHFGESKIERGYDHEDIIDSHSPAPQNPNRNSYNQWLWDAGFKHRNELIQGNPDIRRYSEWKADPKYHVDHYVGDRGREWIESGSPEDRPWFCWISFPGPHGPIDCGNLPQADLYDPAEIDMPETNFEMLAQKPPHNSLRGGPEHQEPFTKDEIRKLRHAYYANVTLIDEKIGAIVQALKNSGAYDNTLIFFTSDHGDFMGDFQLMAKGQNIMEVLMRIPFIIKPPKGGARGKVESSLISAIDIAATSLTVAGAEVPEHMASRDLSHYWSHAEDLDDRDELYMEAAGIRCLRTRRWKIGHYWNKPYGELYDLENDPWEKENLWDRRDIAELKSKLQKRLLDKLIELSPRSYIAWNHGAPEL